MIYVLLIHFSYFWGYFGDKKGKKLALICSCAGAAATTLLFGFSRNFYWAMIARFLQGAFGKCLDNRNYVKYFHMLIVRFLTVFIMIIIR